MMVGGKRKKTELKKQEKRNVEEEQQQHAPVGPPLTRHWPAVRSHNEYKSSRLASAGHQERNKE